MQILEVLLQYKVYCMSGDILCIVGIYGCKCGGGSTPEFSGVPGVHKSPRSAFDISTTEPFIATPYLQVIISLCPRSFK